MPEFNPRPKNLEEVEPQVATFINYLERNIGEKDYHKERAKLNRIAFFVDYLSKLDLDDVKKFSSPEDLSEEDLPNRSLLEDKFERLKEELCITRFHRKGDNPQEEVVEQDFESLKGEIVDFISSNGNDYIEYLESVASNSEKEVIVFLREKIDEYYNSFSVEIDELKQKIVETARSGGSYEDIDEYLDRGQYGCVFKINISGEDYAVKFNISEEGRIDRINNFNEFAAFNKAEDCELGRISRLQAASLTQGVMVMDFIEGEKLTSKFNEDEFNLDPTEMKELLISIIELYRAGLKPDCNLDNFLYNPDAKEEKIGIIDYNSYNIDVSNLDNDSLGEIVAYALDEEIFEFFKKLEYENTNNKDKNELIRMLEIYKQMKDVLSQKISEAKIEDTAKFYQSILNSFDKKLKSNEGYFRASLKDEQEHLEGEEIRKARRLIGELTSGNVVK